MILLQLDNQVQKPALCILGYGNCSRGDDAAGPLLLARIQQSVDWSLAKFSVRFVEDIQLNPEHVFDLQGADVAVFVDSSMTLQKGYAFERIFAASVQEFSSHLQAPENILALFLQAQMGKLPMTFFLGIAGVNFELNTPLSPETARSLESASRFFCDLLQTPLHRWPSSKVFSEETKPGRQNA